MDNANDHDLLIALNTKMEMLLSVQTQFMSQWGKLLERITAIEIQQTKTTTEIGNIKEEVDDLRNKTNAADRINNIIATIAAAIAGAIGYFFGPR